MQGSPMPSNTHNDDNDDDGSSSFGTALTGAVTGTSYHPRSSTPNNVPVPSSPGKRPPTPLQIDEEEGREDESESGKIDGQKEQQEHEHEQEEPSRGSNSLGAGQMVDLNEADIVRGVPSVGQEASFPSSLSSSSMNTGLNTQEEAPGSSRQQETSSELSTRPAQDAPPLRTAWHAMPGFEELDESWVAPPASASAPAPAPAHAPASAPASQLEPVQRQLPEQDMPPLTRATSSNGTARTSSTAKPLASSATSLDSAFERRKRSSPHQTSSNERRALTDSELQAGPSSPSKRVPSHRRVRRGSHSPSSAPEDLVERRPVSPVPSTASRSSSSSGAKQGSRNMRQSGAPDAEHFGTARERLVSRSSQPDGEEQEASTSKAVTAEEGATFIEHADVASPPPMFKPAWAQPKGPGGRRKGWKGDMFSPSKLQRMFDPPTPPPRQQPQEQPQEQSQEQEREPREGGSAEKAHDEGPQEFEKQAEAKVSPPRGPFTFASPSPPIPRTPSVEREEQEATPARIGANGRPMSSLFPPEYRARHRDVIETPRSERRIRAAAATVHRQRGSALANVLERRQESADEDDLEELREGERERERERKRQRLDERPRWWKENEGQRDLGSLRKSVGLQEARRDYVREAPGFMDLIRNTRLASDPATATTIGPQATLSRSILSISRGGAKAPTPRASMRHDLEEEDEGLTSHESPQRASQRRRPPGSSSPSSSSAQAQRESPMKLLRRWSAAAQVDSEIQEEQDAEDRAEQRWSNRQSRSRLPLVSVQSPSQRISRPVDGFEDDEEEEWRTTEGEEAEGVDEGADVAKVAQKAIASSRARQSAQHAATAAGAGGMLRIAPEDVPQDEMDLLGGGRMSFDRKANKWVSNRGSGGAARRPGAEKRSEVLRRGLDDIREAFHDANSRTRRAAENSGQQSSDYSDPFRDFESIASDTRRINGPLSPASSSRQQQQQQQQRAAVAAAPWRAHARSGSALKNEVVFTEGDSISTASSPRANDLQVPPHRPFAPLTPPHPALQIKSGHTHAAHTPSPSRPFTASPNPPRSILKTAASHTAMRTPERDDSPARPEPRSISFADGKTAGPMYGIGKARGDRPGIHEEFMPGSSGGSFDRSYKAERIGELLQELAEITLNDGMAVEELEETPTRKGAVSLARSSSAMSTGADSRSHWSYGAFRRQRQGEGDAGDFNQSFLTSASFNVAHDRILEAITDVAPWEPGWEEMKTVDLSNRRVESVVRLKEFLPRLEEIRLDNNQISYLTGLPSTVRTLSVRHNWLPATVSFGHLLHLETLDVSFNDVESLSALSCLHNLRSLKAQGIGIESLEGIEDLSKLVDVDLSNNHLQALNADVLHWPALESLSLSRNHLVTVRGLSTLLKLRSLNLDHNRLSRLDLGPAMPRLRALRVSGNAGLTHLDVDPARRLRTLYADNCALDKVQNLDRLKRLENLSLRQQHRRQETVAGLVWPAHEVRDCKRLFLSGNAFRAGSLEDLGGSKSLQVVSPAPFSPPVRFLNLVYLELSACQLTSLPSDLPHLAPNMRHLNADHNLFATLPSLHGMARLKRLSLVGCRIKRTRTIIEALQGMVELHVLDVRMNPCTLGLYPPLVVAVSGALASGPNPVSMTKAAFLPPIPHPDVVQPDVARRMEREAKRSLQRQKRLNEKSFFHKRRPSDWDPAIGRGHDDEEEEDEGEDQDEESGHLGDEDHADDEEEEQVNEAQRGAKGPAKKVTSATLFSKTDEAFSKTLPPAFATRRLLHRGTLAMACPNLTWLDGLLVDEHEVRMADERLRMRSGLR